MEHNTPDPLLAYAWGVVAVEYAPPPFLQNEMNKEIKTKWLEALRSGEYEQVQCRLHTNRGYCCLGVLCDILGVKWEKSDNAFRLPDGWLGTPSPEVISEARLPIRWYELAEMNDGGHVGFDGEQPFSVIADFIEANY